MRHWVAGLVRRMDMTAEAGTTSGMADSEADSDERSEASLPLIDVRRDKNAVDHHNILALQPHPSAYVEGRSLVESEAMQTHMV